MNEKSKPVIELDEIQKIVYGYLKKEGYKKNGRTFNKKNEEGLFQIINFQMGQFPIGSNYEIEGLRQNLYGKFTVNMGVYIEELFKYKFPYDKSKTIQEYHCTFRTRLGPLLNGEDYWWELQNKANETSETIISAIEIFGNDWFYQLNSRDKIYENGKNQHKIGKLDVGILMILNNKIEEGKSLFEEYYESVEKDKIQHLNYLDNLRIQLKI